MSSLREYDYETSTNCVYVPTFWPFSFPSPAVLCICLPHARTGEPSCEHDQIAQSYIQPELNKQT